MSGSKSMCLAEANSRLSEITSLLGALRASLTRVSFSRVPAMFNKANALLSEYEELKRRVRTTESKTMLSGTSILDFKSVISSLEERIDFYSSIAEHRDLPEETVLIARDSIKNFQSTRDKLIDKYDEISWEVELLE